MYTLYIMDILMLPTRPGFMLGTGFFSLIGVAIFAYTIYKSEEEAVISQCYPHSYIAFFMWLMLTVCLFYMAVAIYRKEPFEQDERKRKY
jgi:hypothetical protein